MEKVGQSDGSYLLYSKSSPAFENTGAYNTSAVNLTGDAEPERLASAEITASLLPTLRVVPIAGRDLGTSRQRRSRRELDPGAPRRDGESSHRVGK